MKQYVQKIELFFELKGTPDSFRESYRRRMWAFLNYMQNIKRPIEELSPDDIQQYILYLKKEKGLSAGTINNYISAIKFFYTYVLEREWNPIKVPRMKRTQKFPVVPSREEILSLLNSTNNIKHKAILLLIYPMIRYRTGDAMLPSFWTASCAAQNPIKGPKENAK
jgi:integrase/recombinase XerD